MSNMSCNMQNIQSHVLFDCLPETECLVPLKLLSRTSVSTVPALLSRSTTEELGEGRAESSPSWPLCE